MTNNSLFVSFQMYFTYMFLFIIFFVWNGIEVMEVHNCDIYFSPAGIVRCIYYMLWHKRYPHEDLYLLLFQQRPGESSALLVIYKQIIYRTHMHQPRVSMQKLRNTGSTILLLGILSDESNNRTSCSAVVVGRSCVRLANKYIASVGL